MLLEAQDIVYEVNGKEILHVEHLQIQKGDYIGIVGKNGSGKTSLAKILTGQENHYSGTVHSDGSVEFIPQIKETNTYKSGGEVTQAYINQAVARKADILVADEPTTNLDQEHMEKLETHLKRWNGAVVIISHDRFFLDNLCTQIWEVKDGKVTIFPGNYSAYREQKEIEIHKQKEDYKAYIAKKQQLEQALGLKKKKAARAAPSPRNPYYAKKQKKLEKSASSIKTRLEKLEVVEKLKEEPPLNMDIINEELLGNKTIIRIENLEGHVGNRVLWKNAKFYIHAGDKIGIIGNNGTGKTTFLKRIISHAKGIDINPSVKIGYFSQNLDILNHEQTILENVTATSSQELSFIRTVLGRLHFYRDDVYKKIEVLSGGERVKVGFAKIFLSDVNTLILDEPTNYLDIEAIEALESLLMDYKGTVLFVSHDRRFLDHIANKIITIENKEMTFFEGNYREYVDYQPEETDEIEQKLLLIETKITDVLSRLSINPDPELENEFQELLKQKKQFMKKKDESK